VDAADAPREHGAAGKESRSGRSDEYSGRLLLRMPKSLHAALARASEARNVSLNAFINDALQQAVDPKRRGTDAATPSSTGGQNRPRTIDRLLVANLLVVAVVGLLAVALLVEALR